MNKNILIGVFSAILIVAIGTVAYYVIGAQVAVATNTAITGQGGAGKTGIGNKNTTNTSVLSLPASEVSVAEKAALLYMREEEKLARDVYNSLFVTWNNNLFQNIAGSEQKHMDEIALMLTRYNLSDPAQAPGIFTEVKLQDLYDRLVAQGKLSIGDALKVGGAIEEIDILDLQTHLAQTNNADIQLVYKNLMSGSYKHLRSFTSTLTSQTGETYAPQYLPPELYQSIINGGTANNNYGHNVAKIAADPGLH